MTDADVQAIGHAGNGKDQQRGPNTTPMPVHAGRYCGELRSAARPNYQGNRNSKRRQEEKRERRFQESQNREIKPHTMRICMTEDVRGTACCSERESN